MPIEFTFTPAQEALLCLSALAGAAHVFSPDHWMPSALVAWRKGWHLPKLLSILSFAFLIHVALGFGLYLLLLPLLLKLEPLNLWFACLGLIGAGAAVRSLRLNLVAQTLTRALPGGSALLGVLRCLGPAEILVTVLIKSRSLGMGYLPGLLTFLGGSLIAGAALAILGRRQFNQPGQLPRALKLSAQRFLSFPAGACVVFGAALVLKITNF